MAKPTPALFCTLILTAGALTPLAVVADKTHAGDYGYQPVYDDDYDDHDKRPQHGAHRDGLDGKHSNGASQARPKYDPYNCGRNKRYGHDGGHRDGYGNDDGHNRRYGNRKYGHNSRHGRGRDSSHNRRYGDRGYGSGNRDYGHNRGYGNRDYGRNRGYGNRDYGHNRSYGNRDYGHNRGYGNRSYGHNRGYGSRGSHGRSYPRTPKGMRLYRR